MHVGPAVEGNHASGLHILRKRKQRSGRRGSLHTVSACNEPAASVARQQSQLQAVARTVTRRLSAAPLPSTKEVRDAALAGAATCNSSSCTSSTSTTRKASTSAAAVDLLRRIDLEEVVDGADLLESYTAKEIAASYILTCRMEVGLNASRHPPRTLSLPRPPASADLSHRCGMFTPRCGMFTGPRQGDQSTVG